MEKKKFEERIANYMYGYNILVTTSWLFNSGRSKASTKIKNLFLFGIFDEVS